VKAWLTRIDRLVFGRYEKKPQFALVATLLFAAALILMHQHHEGWRDELHCWSVGRNAAGLWDLMVGDRRYDGHPFLWYYLLYLASRISRAPVMLHITTIVVATSAAYLWLRQSGAPRVVRLLLLPSYLFFYEYSVVCRSYILGCLLLFAFCSLYRKGQVRYVALAIVLTLLALTSLYGTIMSGALAIFLFTRGLRFFGREPSGKLRLLSTHRGYWLGLCVYLLGVALTAATSMPPADDTFAQVWYIDQMGWENVKKALLAFWWAFLPTSTDWFSVSYLGIDTPSLTQYLPWLAAGLCGLWLLAMRRAPTVAFSFVFAALLMGFFQQSKYPGGLRHVGNVFLFLLTCAWLARREVVATRRLRLLWLLLAFCLMVQIKSAWSATTEDWRRPFSGGLQAADYLTRKYPPGTLIIGSNDFISSVVAGYADRGFLFAETGDFGESVVSHNRRAYPTQESIERLAKNNIEGRDRLVLVLNFALYRQSSSLEISQPFTTDPSIVPDERLWIYEVRSKAGNNPSAKH
jgi:hypothetical protein